MCPTLYGIYMRDWLTYHRFYTGSGLAVAQRNMPVSCGDFVADRGNPSMLDVIYILIGAAFLGACVLYAYACDEL